MAYAQSGRRIGFAGLGRFEEAAQDFESSIRNCSANAWVHYNHGLMHHQLGKAEKAVVCFQLALEFRGPSLPPRKRDRARGYIRRYRKTSEAAAPGDRRREPSVGEGKQASAEQMLAGIAQAAESAGTGRRPRSQLRDLLKVGARRPGRPPAPGPLAVLARQG